MELTDKSERRLKSWLLFHEDEIAIGLEDFGAATSKRVARRSTASCGTAGYAERLRIRK